VAQRSKRSAKSGGNGGATWKVTLPCTRAEAERLKGDLPALALLDTPPVLMTSESDPARPEEWRLDAYFDARPGADDIALLHSLLPDSGHAHPIVERVADQDWVTLSQEGLEPIRAGRFYVHTAAQKVGAPADAIAFEIDAGRAFGTGHHATTTGCLMALDRLRNRGASFASIVDIGTGTGLLAFAALKLWPLARVAASDVDPIAVEVARENARINGIRTGRARGCIEMMTAPGLRHYRLKAHAPYDLVIANILAGPLIRLAPSIVAALDSAGHLILAGLLEEQSERVLAAYRTRGMMPLFHVQLGDWPALVMRKRRTVRRRR
jgi:ribosomal protein L11 methyltransferase